MITVVQPLADGHARYTDRPGHPCTDADATGIQTALAAAGITVACVACPDGLHLSTGPLSTSELVFVLRAVKTRTDSRIWWETP